VGGFTLLTTTDTATATQLDNLIEFQQQFAETLSRFAEPYFCYTLFLRKLASAETCFC
jgi:hypothetical protein